MLPIFIISLAEATERRQRMTDIMNSLGLEFEFIDAVDGRKSPPLEQDIYNAKKRLKCFGKHLTGGEIGCTLSHKFLYEKIVNENIEQALIFEDDIIIHPHFLETLQEILKMPVPFEMIRFLSSPKLERLKLRPVYQFKNNHTLTRHTGMPGGSHATLVTKQAAEKMLKNIQHIAYPIDAILGRSWKTHINWYTVRPGLVAQDRAIESMIGDGVRFDNKKDIQGWQKFTYPVTRAWFKICETIGKKYWYLKTYFWDKKHGNF